MKKTNLHAIHVESWVFYSSMVDWSELNRFNTRPTCSMQHAAVALLGRH